MSMHPVRIWVWAAVALVAWVTAAVAQDQPYPPPSAALVDLNRAIRAYAAEDRDTAAEIFERLLKTESAAEFRIPCLYHLGLIGLERGLAAASAAQAARAQNAADEAQQKAREALAEFEHAQQYFGEVVRVADPTAEVVNAALLLGVAQLASDYPGAEVSAFDLAKRAEETLRRYSEAEYGARDRYAFFYLAVARYRLADAYRDRPGSGREYAEALQGAKQDLAKARALAEEDSQANRLSATDFENFKTVLTYYDGLLNILQQDNVGARQAFVEVGQRAAGTDLAKNADAIVNKLDEVAATSPQPITLPVPKPIGPWELDGRLRVGNWYDSNVILLGKDTHLPLGYTHKGDYQLGLSADFNLSRYISKSEAPWVGESLTIGMGGGTQNIWQPNIAQYDVNRYPGRAYFNWQPIRDLYFGLQYEYSYAQLGHEPYIASNRVTPVISKTWRGAARDGGAEGLEIGRTDLYFTQDDRSYMDRIVDLRTNRDGVYRSAGIQHTINFIRAKDYLQGYFDTHEKERRLFGDDWLHFYVGYEFRDEQTVGTEFDMRGHSMVWGLGVPLPYRFAFELNGEFTWGDYSNPSIYDYSRKCRQDMLQRYDFGVTYTFVARGEDPNFPTLNVRLRSGIEMTFQNSNIWDRLGEDIYEYNRAVYGVQLQVDF